MPFNFAGPDSGGSNIGDGTLYAFDLPVADAGTITDLNVSVDLGGGCQRDIDLTISNGATTVVLYLNDSTCPEIDATFDDEGAAAVDDVDLTGNIIPVQALSAFDGQSLAGTWTLIVQDNSCCQGENTTLEAWSISGTTDETSDVPEPLSAALLAAGLLGLGWSRRRRSAV